MTRAPSSGSSARNAQVLTLRARWLLAVLNGLFAAAATVIGLLLFAGAALKEPLSSALLGFGTVAFLSVTLVMAVGLEPLAWLVRRRSARPAVSAGLCALVGVLASALACSLGIAFSWLPQNEVGEAFVSVLVGPAFFVEAAVRTFGVTIGLAAFVGAANGRWLSRSATNPRWQHAVWKPKSDSLWRRRAWIRGLLYGAIYAGFFGALYELIPVERFVLPTGYRGHVTFDVERPECPPLPRIFRGRLYRLSQNPKRPLGADAYGCTSESLLYKPQHTQVFYADGTKLPDPFHAGEEDMVWGGVTGSESRTLRSTAEGERVPEEPAKNFYAFFVGPKDEWENSWNPVFQLPEGFSGWVTLRTQDASCPWLDDLVNVIAVPASGEVCMRFVQRVPLWNKSRVFGANREPIPYGVPGQGGRIWGETPVTQRDGGVFKELFVGTEAEYRGVLDGGSR